MTMLLVGECLGTKAEPVSYEGREWIERTIVVLAGLDSVHARVARNFDQSRMPAKGEFVVLEVEVNVYRTKNGVDYRLVALQRADKAEDALAPLVSA